MPRIDLSDSQKYYIDLHLVREFSCLHVTKVLLISLLSLVTFTLSAQRVTIMVIKTENRVSSDWQITDERYQTIFPGSHYFTKDTVSFTLDANKRYFLQISVSGIHYADTGLYALRVDGEPVMLISSLIEPGDHFYPFFTGTKTTLTKITGGTDANISEFPWQVFYKSGNYQCGGSIISENWVITAAHCTKNSNGITMSPSEMMVKVGATNPYDTLQGKKYYISDVIVHEGYNSQSQENDIALLKLKDPVSFANAVPIKLISSDDVANGATDPGVMSWVTGWGLTRVRPDVLATNLQKVQLPIISNAQAATVWNSIPATDIMAGYLNGNKDACNGDSGGPLVVPVADGYKLAGIVSWGSQNCNTYGGYARISSFETWIRTKTGIAKEYAPPSPFGDSIICMGVISSQYSVGKLLNATAYEWQLSPVNAGSISGNSEIATVMWNKGFTGSVIVKLRITVNSVVSEWSYLKLRIVQNTNLVSQSGDTALCAGQPVILKAKAEGYNLTYKWLRDGSIVQAGNSNELKILTTFISNSGIYKCEISGSCGTIFSNIMNLTVHPLTRISYLSPDINVSFGDDVYLEVSTEGHDLTYQWQKNGKLLDNGNMSQLVLHNVNANDIGTYKTKVTGTCGTEISDTIYVYVKKQDYSAEPEVFLWPTIAGDEFKIALSNDDYYNIRLFDSLGDFVKELTKCRYQTTVDVSTLSGGVYIVNVYNKYFRKSIRMIKK
jgi:hypothetical protein